VAFGRRLGTVTTAHPTVPAIDDNAFVLNLDSGYGGGRANNWHTDVTFVDQPPAGPFLRAVVIPPYAATRCGNTVAAYEELPDHLRTMARPLGRAQHTFDYAQLALATEHPAADQLAKYAAVSLRRSTTPSTPSCGYIPRQGNGPSSSVGSPGRSRTSPRRSHSRFSSFPERHHPTGAHCALAVARG